MLRAIAYLEDDSILQKVCVYNISANAMFICCARQKKIQQRKMLELAQRAQTPNEATMGVKRQV